MIRGGYLSLLIGLDPGGEGAFGWAIVEHAASLPLSIVATGCSSSAAEAVAAVTHEVRGEVVAAAAIDTPLFWSRTGDRAADKSVRGGIRRAGAKTPGGTVQHVNSLRGACLVQGVVAAMLLREAWPGLPISEAHPKALLWLLGVAVPELHPSLVTLQSLERYFTRARGGEPEHERDAVIGALSAWGAVTRPPGWQDLVVNEPSPLLPVAHPLSYWMPRIVAGAA